MNQERSEVPPATLRRGRGSSDRSEVLEGATGRSTDVGQDSTGPRR